MSHPHPQEERSFRISLKSNIRKLLLFVLAIATFESVVFLGKMHDDRSTITTYSEDVIVTANQMNSTLHSGPKRYSIPKTAGENRSTGGDNTPPPMMNSPNATVVAKNRECLRHLLDLNVVEYYHYPENDSDNLNFTVKGSVSRTRFVSGRSKPSLVSRHQPTFRRTFDSIRAKAPGLQRNACRSDIVNFLPNMMARDYDLLRNLVKFFKHVAALSGMEYYLNYGSLLGHVRFDGRPIPWDDDLDFSVDYSVLKKFQRIFKRERRIYFANRTEGDFYPDFHVGKIWTKIFDASQTKVGKYNWTFPFIDLFFYRLTNEDFYDIPDEELTSSLLTDGLNSESAYNLSIGLAMPFKKDLFMGLELPMPAKAVKILRRLKYSTSVCKPLWWHHRFEKATRSSLGTIDCSLLEGFYDFVNGL